jgi:hypothetical protein
MGLGLGIGLAGTALNAGLNAAVSGQQEKIAQQNANQQSALHGQAMSDVANAANAAAGVPQAAAGQTAYSAGQYADALKGAGAAAAAPSIAGADPRYAAANATNAASVGSYTDALTGALSRTQGVQTAQRLAQQQEMTEATNVSALQSESYADSLVNQMRQQTIKANPILSGIATGMELAGAAMALRAKSGVGAGSAYSKAGAGGFTEAGTPIAAGGTDLGGSAASAVTGGDLGGSSGDDA